MNTRNIIVISGPSGAGKDTVIEGLIKRGWDVERIITTSTRPMRSGEAPGKPYYFVSPGEFEHGIAAGDFIEHADVYGNRYGVTRRELARAAAAGKLVIWKVDYEGTKNIKRVFPEIKSIAIMPTSLDELAERIKERGQDSDDIIQARMERTRQQFTDLTPFDYVVVNAAGKLEAAIDEVEGIIRSLMK